MGWVLSHAIVVADADEIDELLPPRPKDGVLQAIPYRYRLRAPEVRQLSDEDVLDDSWFTIWMGIKNDPYFFRRKGNEMPDRSVLAWLGYLRGDLEGNGLKQAEYELLRALLPPVHDELTPLLEAMP